MNHLTSRLGRTRATVFLTTLSLVALTIPNIGIAQTTNITSSGLGTTVKPPVAGTTSIVGGTAAGTNLFHSFGNFSIGAGEIARFETNNGVANSSTSNIISRVTGNNPSSLFGTLDTKSYFPSANFFLVNPNGIVFGPNASINVGGSANFVAGDYLRMTDKAQFFANPAQTSTLSVNPVSSFGFLSGNPLGTIQVQGGTILNQSALTLVGRDKVNGATTTPGIEVTGTLSNPGGDIRLVSVGTPTNPNVGGEVTALAPSTPQGFTSLGSIAVANGGVISTTNLPDESSGNIFIRTGKLLVNDGQLLTDTAKTCCSSKPLFITGSIEAHADSVVLNKATVSTTAQSRYTQGGNIDFSDIGNLTATDSTISASTTDAKVGYITIGSPTTSSITLAHTSIDVTHGIQGSPGIIRLTGNSIELNNNTKLAAVAFDSGFGGTIRLNGNNINVSGSSLIASDSGGGGGGGPIFLEGLSSTDSAPTQARTVALTNDTAITTGTTSQGFGNRITIRAESVLMDRATVATEAPLKSGSILVEAGSLTLQNGAKLSTRVVDDPNVPSSGTGGDITIHADTITLNGQSGILSSTNRKGVGGDIDIASHSIRMSDGARIDASTSGVGSAGNLSIASEQVTGDNSTFISSSSTGTGLAFNNTSGKTEAGLAGNISLTSPTNLTLRGMTIKTTSEATSGGNIKLTAPNIIRIVDSTLSSSVKGAANNSNGGNISIDPQLVVIQNSNLLANANAGAGGNITVIASGAVLVDPNSQLNASAGPAGVSGSVNINTPVQVLGGALVPLKIAYTQAGLSGDRCAADPKGQFSSFVQTGRDGVPQVPGALSPSPLSFLDTLTSGSLDLGTKNLAAAQLGFDSLSLDDSALFRFHSACRS